MISYFFAAALETRKHCAWIKGMLGWWDDRGVSRPAYLYLKYSAQCKPMR
jgi:hypothetical protein